MRVRVSAIGARRSVHGHSARALVAPKVTQLAYLSVIAAMLARVGMAVLPAFAAPLMNIAACVWILAFLAFLAAYAPMLVRPARASGS